MADVIYTSPEDGGHAAADVDDIVGLMRSRGEEYWNCPNGSGFAGLMYFPEGNGREPGMAAGLAFTKLDRLNFHSAYHYRVANLASPYYREPEYYFSHAGGPLAGRSRVNCAGEWELVFDALFVDLVAAEAAVREFVARGERSPAVGWIWSGEVVRAEGAIGS